ncbi:MAG: zinc ribbon domain-containing protein [Burkholderiales bacterium]|nr:zinc ribbon domain-containing protein [Burkholderiales bacterium]
MLFLAGCIEVDEQYKVGRNGKADSRVVVTIDPAYESVVFPAVKKKLQEDPPPPGITVDSSQRIDGKAAVVMEGKGIDLGNTNATLQPMQLTESSGGFLRKRYTVTVRVVRQPDVPIPHRLRISLPGSIEHSNGKQVDAETVEFDLTHARVGALYQVSSTALALPFLSGESPANQGPQTAAPGPEGPGSTASRWILPASLGVLAVAVLAFIGWWFVRRRPRAVSAATATATATASPSPSAGFVAQQVDPRPPQRERIFCSECGAPQEATRKFCTECGAGLS